MRRFGVDWREIVGGGLAPMRVVPALEELNTTIRASTSVFRGGDRIRGEPLPSLIHEPRRHMTEGLTHCPRSGLNDAMSIQTTDSALSDCPSHFRSIGNINRQE